MELNIASQAKLSVAMVSPRRCREIADLVRGKMIVEAYRSLSLEKVKSADILLKLLRSAMSNAQQKGVADMDRLYVSELRIDEGPRIKRWMPRAQGRADRRVTRTSHIVLKLSEKKAVKATKAKSAAKKAKTKDGVK